MKKNILFLLACLFLMSSASVTFASEKKQKKSKEKEICISFDELPAAQGFHDSDRKAINYLILQALKKHEVSAIGFVLGEQIEESFDLIGE